MIMSASQKERFLESIRAWATCSSELNYRDHYYLDPEIQATNDALVDATNAMIILCRRKLKEAGLDK